MQRFLAAFLLVFLLASVSFGGNGDPILIDYFSLKSFSHFQPEGCVQEGESSSATIYLYVKYLQDGTERTFLEKLERHSRFNEPYSIEEIHSWDENCARARRRVFSDLKTWNERLTDIKNCNVSPGPAYAEAYYSGTLTGETKLQGGGTADVGELNLRTRAARCFSFKLPVEPPAKVH